MSIVLEKNRSNALIVQTSSQILRAGISTLPVSTQTSQRKNEEKLLLFYSQARQLQVKHELIGAFFSSIRQYYLLHIWDRMTRYLPSFPYLYKEIFTLILTQKYSEFIIWIAIAISFKQIHRVAFYGSGCIKALSKLVSVVPTNNPVQRNQSY